MCKVKVYVHVQEEEGFKITKSERTYFMYDPKVIVMVKYDENILILKYNEMKHIFF